MSSWILDFIHSMAFSCPLNRYISKPYPALLFNLFPFNLQESFEFGSFKNLYTNLDIFGIKENLERIVITQKKVKRHT